MVQLVVVESPAKCSKIQGFLGDGWRVLASMGHIRKLVEDLKALHIEDGFKPEFEFMSEKSKTIAQLRAAAKDASKVYLASDDDREGEMISYSVALALKLDVQKNPRIVFHEITKTAVLNAIANPRTISMQRVDSQQARAVLDLMVGFTISPLLWSISNGLSAGRCQTPALRLIVEREKEIKKFQKDSSFEIRGVWKSQTSFSGKMIDTLSSEEDATNYLENVHDLLNATITEVNTKPTSYNPPPPLITSSLQQDASALFGSNPKSTMKTAQKLYEAGLITYMRTDSTLMSVEAQNDAKKSVEQKYGSEYVSDTIKTVKSKSKDTKTQDAHAERNSKGISSQASQTSLGAHEAIRPTHFSTDVLSGEFHPMERKIYSLIYKRAIQSVMAPAKGDERRIRWVIDDDPNEFIHEGVWKRTTFQGWKIVGQKEADLDEKEDEEVEQWKSSESLEVNKKIQWISLTAEQKYTTPPARFNEATLVRELEKKGIGRPSTFASLVASIIDKEYVKLDSPKVEPVKIVKLSLEKPNKLPVIRSETTKTAKQEKEKLVSTDLGVKVYEFCVREFSQLFDYEFTRTMETRLDAIEKDNEPWRTVCIDTYNSYKDKYAELKKAPKAKNESVQFEDSVEAVQTRKGPFLIKEKKILGWPSGVSFSDINQVVVNEFLKKRSETDDLVLGYHNEKPLIKKKGPFGYYVQYDSKNIKFEESDSLETILEKIKVKSESLLHTAGEFEVRKGPYGNYIMKKQTIKGKKPKFVSIPSDLNPKELSLEALKTLYENGSTAKKKFKKY